MNSGFMPTFPPNPDPPRSSSKVKWSFIAVLVVVVVSGAVAGWQRFSSSLAPEAPTRVVVADSTARAPAGTRIRVRVLNTTTTSGLARRATFALRDLGYDVVDFDSESSDRSTTLILAHTARSDWGVRLQRAVGTTAMEARADSSRFVDFTVLIGRDWQPPPQPFRP